MSKVSTLLSKGSDLKFSFRQIDDLLADLHSIATNKRTQFRARIRNLQRIGLLGSDNRGVGRRANFTFEDVLKLAISFELLQIGMTPERSLRVVHNTWIQIGPAIAKIMAPQWETGAAHQFMYYSPAALDELQFANKEGTLGLFGIAELADIEVLLKRPVQEPRFVLLNITVLLGQVSHLLTQHLQVALEAIRAEAKLLMAKDSGVV